MTTSSVKENQNKHAPQGTKSSPVWNSHGEFSYPYFTEMARINSYIVRARTQNDNATTEVFLEAAEQYAKADGKLDEVGLEKMRKKLRNSVEVDGSESYWTRVITQLEAGLERQKRPKAYNEAKLKETTDENSPQRITLNSFRTSIGPVNYPYLIELARINSYILKARTQNANATTKTLIEAAEQYAKADGKLDEAGFEKMRQKLRINFEVKGPESFWTDPIPKFEAARDRQARLDNEVNSKKMI